MILAIALLVPQVGMSADPTPPPDAKSVIEAFFQALQDWFNSKSGSTAGGNSSGTTTDPAASPDASPAGMPDASAAAASVAPAVLAQAIANDAGGHADQYDYYSKRLSETLSMLTPAQRARVLGN